MQAARELSVGSETVTQARGTLGEWKKAQDHFQHVVLMKINRDIFNSPNVKDGNQKSLQFAQNIFGRQRLGRKATVDLKNIPIIHKKVKLKR